MQFGISPQVRSGQVGSHLKAALQQGFISCIELYNEKGPVFCLEKALRDGKIIA